MTNKKALTNRNLSELFISIIGASSQIAVAIVNNNANNYGIEICHFFLCECKYRRFSSKMPLFL
jgi:hypothetical protein